jgi:hypothetical protein
VKYVKHENGHNITCMELEKYMISKEDLEQTSCERRLLKDWDIKKRDKAMQVRRNQFRSRSLSSNYGEISRTVCPYAEPQIAKGTINRALLPALIVFFFAIRLSPYIFILCI